MDDDIIRALLHEGASMRLVLVHMLAQLSRSQLKTISESIDRDLATMEVPGLQIEKAMIPYRDCVDDILARALQIQGSKD
jgi:hypothetical protein